MKSNLANNINDAKIYPLEHAVKFDEQNLFSNEKMLENSEVRSFKLMKDGSPLPFGITIFQLF